MQRNRNQDAFDLPTIWLDDLEPIWCQCSAGSTFRSDVILNITIIVPISDERGLDAYMYVNCG